MNYQKDVKKIFAQIKLLRNMLNNNPEFSFKEKKTSSFLKSFLIKNGINEKDIKNVKIAKTGFYVDVVGQKKQLKLKKYKNYLFRADMDAVSNRDRSECLHLCGHDGHSTMLAAAAVLTYKYRDKFSGIRRFIFQPAEELDEGAKLMVKGGVLNKMDAAFAIHNVPGIKTGVIGIKKGLFMAYSVSFKVEIIGKGSGHGRIVDKRLDSARAMSEFIEYLYKVPKIVKTNSGDISMSIFSYYSKGEVVNPEEGHIAFDFKFESKNKVLAAYKLLKIKEQQFKKRGYKISIKINEHIFDGFINDEKYSNKFINILKRNKIPFIELKDPANASEDFGKYIEKIPGFMFNVGNGNSAPLHNKKYNFNDKAMVNGVNAFLSIALDW